MAKNTATVQIVGLEELEALVLRVEAAARTLHDAVERFEAAAKRVPVGRPSHSLPMEKPDR